MLTPCTVHCLARQLIRTSAGAPRTTLTPLSWKCTLCRGAPLQAHDSRKDTWERKAHMAQNNPVRPVLFHILLLTYSRAPKRWLSPHMPTPPDIIRGGFHKTNQQGYPNSSEATPPQDQRNHSAVVSQTQSRLRASVGEDTKCWQAQ